MSSGRSPSAAVKPDLDDGNAEYNLDRGRVFTFCPGESDTPERLDKFVSRSLPELSRSFLQHLIDEGQVLVNGIAVRRSHKIGASDVITVVVPEPAGAELELEPMALDVIYEDRDVIVLEKPAGLVVHPAPGHPRGTLVNALLAHAPDMVVNGSHRPGIVHRLDKDTTGLMVVAKNDRAKLALIEQWQERSVEKGYVALVRGVVEPETATIDAPIARDPANRKRMAVITGGRPAITNLRVTRRYRDCTLLDVELATGRTHQARVHLAFIGHPIVGDALYNPHTGPTGGNKALISRQFLHAARLGFVLPCGRVVRFSSNLPADLQQVLDLLNDEAA